MTLGQAGVRHQEVRAAQQSASLLAVRCTARSLACLIGGSVQRDCQLRSAVAHKVLQVRHQAHCGHGDLHSVEERWRCRCSLPMGSIGVMSAINKQAHPAPARLVMGEVQSQRVAQDVHCCQDGVCIVQGLPHAHEDDVGDGGCSRHSRWSSGKLQQGRGAPRMPPYCAGALSCWTLHRQWWCWVLQHTQQASEGEQRR